MGRRSAFLSRAVQYALSVVLIASVTALFFVLREVLDTTLVALLYLLPLGLITAFWGLGPGITSALLTFLAFNYFFIRPYYNLAVHRPLDVVILIVFLIVAAVISQLVGRMQQSLEAAKAREREATQLYELSTALAGLQDDQRLAQILATQVQNVVQGEYVELSISAEKPFLYHLPEARPPGRSPDITFPIQAARGILGEIRLWRQDRPITGEEKRLLQTFASQGALALERARLVQAESRAQVLEESDRLKTAILSSVSHELRTPLSTIKAAASSLRDHEVNLELAGQRGPDRGHRR